MGCLVGLIGLISGIFIGIMGLLFGLIGSVFNNVFGFIFDSLRLVFLLPFLLFLVPVLIVFALIKLMSFLSKFPEEGRSPEQSDGENLTDTEIIDIEDWEDIKNDPEQKE